MERDHFFLWRKQVSLYRDSHQLQNKVRDGAIVITVTSVIPLISRA